ncbi:MAG: nucleotide sugar dehydrogenase [Bacteroidetes bacterium]|nr:nucleotide sugar dehydrogenase [Bacteroidota bacterium]MBK9414675.1 nucleotide sugar dehydrogenase [Bacteroidota bacterium]MBL0031190.1 nucleotide sugar dehydrogenase [Bacteroidota bacterium]MBP6428366.1 nucleotide sugar dehydrogenase [Bacteroidia bacterium]
MHQELLQKKKKLAVLGLGYVGLPIALEFASKIEVIGFDINEERLDKMRKGIDPSGELSAEQFKNKSIEFTSSLDKLKEASFFIVTVPTPIDEHNLPDLKPLLSATKSIGKVLKKGDYVVYESTVYPGCTEEDCLPILEELSGLKCKTDFKIGYSPERINPGDTEHTITKILKVVSGCDEEALNEISETYQIIVKAGVHRASSIRVAEAAKIIENTQRDVNIALMNELSIIFNKMGINTYDVLEAAGTKWNFIRFQPGLVGGHCIGVDPYYLTYKAQELGYHAQVINSGRYVNDSMGFYVAKQTVKKIIALGKDVSKSKVLVLGATFKENVEDIRNSKVADVVKELISYGVTVEVSDPRANSSELKHEYGFELTKNIGNDYDAVIIAVNHSEYKNFDEAWFSKVLGKDGLIIDIKGIYKGKFSKTHYWSL